MVEPPGSSKTRVILPPEGEENSAGQEKPHTPTRMTTKKMERNCLIYLMMLLKGWEMSSLVEKLLLGRNLICLSHNFVTMS